MPTFRLALTQFPPGFQEDCHRFRKWMEVPALLDLDALVAPLRPATVKHRLAQVLRFGGAVVHAGVPIASLTSFEALLTPANVQSGLQWLLDRNDGVTGPGLSDVGAMIRILAGRCTALPEGDSRQIMAMTRRIKVPSKPGMTAKNRERLRPFLNPALVRRLLDLSERTLSDPDDGSHAAARRQEVALAVLVLLFCPIRRKNLAAIHLDRNLVRMSDGKVLLRFSPEEVKNRRALEFELDPDLVRCIDRYLSIRSPRLCPSGCNWLFARRDGSGPGDPNHLSTSVQAFVRRKLGITVNLHLFRHIAALMCLRAEPGNYEVPRLLLGHSTLSATIEAYADFDQSAAAQLFARVVRSSGANT